MSSLVEKSLKDLNGKMTRDYTIVELRTIEGSFYKVSYSILRIRLVKQLYVRQRTDVYTYLTKSRRTQSKGIFVVLVLYIGICYLCKCFGCTLNSSS